MMNFNIIFGIGIIVFGILYLIFITTNHADNSSESNVKYDEELNVLDSIIHRAKLKNEGKSIDSIIENLKYHNIKINFDIKCGEKNERY